MEKDSRLAKELKAKEAKSKGKPSEAPNIIDYVESEFSTFSEKPPTSVDSLALSWFSYLHLPEAFQGAQGWDGMRLVDAFRADCFDEMYGMLWDVPSSGRLLAAMAANPRFRDVRVMGYRAKSDPATEKQFAAVTLQLTPQLTYVAFRGTDSTLVGWKEDFNMAFLYPVPSQEEAARYLDEAASHCAGKLLVGGHSKGGNLAVYAAMNCSEATRKRINRVFSHDGPGFPDSVFADGTFAKVRDLIDKTLPQSSLVGMLLEHQEDYRIIKSSNFSVFQHDPFSWVVEEGDFVSIESLTPGAKYLDTTLNAWAQSLTEQERERMIDSVYALVGTVDATTLSDVRDHWQTVLPKIIDNALAMDEDTRDFLMRVARELFVLGGKKFPEMFKPD